MSLKKRIAVAGIYHETNTFAPGQTGLADFASEWVAGKDAFVQRYERTRTSMGGVIDAAREADMELVPGLYAQATPSGMVTDETAETIMEELVRSVDLQVDGIVVILHGAMVSESHSDMEGAILRRLREMAGDSVPIAVTIDLHANISRQMVELADIIVGYDTYPHVDVYERAVEAVRLLGRCIGSECRPVRRLAQPRMLAVPQTMQTDAGPMKELLERAWEMERQAGVLNVTVAGGFPYSDVPDAGMAFVVTTDGDAAKAQAYADELAAMAWERRQRFQASLLSPAEALDRALEQQEGPVILAEGSDNVGGGSPADGTHLLPYLLSAPRKSLIVIRDAEAARIAHQLGVGRTFSGSIGGKTDNKHGEPVAVEGTIRTLFDGTYRHAGPYMAGQQAEMGLTAVVEAGNVTIILTERRVPPWDIGHIRSVGLVAEDFHLIVAKSALAWKTAFGGCAKLALDVDTPGCCSANLQHFEYKRVTRPIYPLDADFE